MAEITVIMLPTDEFFIEISLPHMSSLINIHCFERKAKCSEVFCLFVHKVILSTLKSMDLLKCQKYLLGWSVMLPYFKG